MSIFKQLSFFVTLSFIIGTIISCNTTGSDNVPGQGQVQLQFRTNTSTTLAKNEGFILANDDSLVIEGSNGTLKINNIRFIVSEFELEAVDSDDEDDKEEFEGGPFWVDLPLGADTLALGNSPIQAGIYDELEFEIEDLDWDDDDDENEDRDYPELIESIRAEFPEWPDDASMLVTGTFTPANGETQSFKVFAEAEIEIEREFSPPLEITESNTQKILSVQISPEKWFTKDDDSIINLSEYDWDTYGDLLEFEAEFERGVEDVESEDDDDNDDHGDDDS
jgi:hypothetical protein